MNNLCYQAGIFSFCGDTMQPFPFVGSVLNIQNRFSWLLASWSFLWIIISIHPAATSGCWNIQTQTLKWVNREKHALYFMNRWALTSSHSQVNVASPFECSGCPACTDTLYSDYCSGLMVFWALSTESGAWKRHLPMNWLLPSQERGLFVSACMGLFVSINAHSILCWQFPQFYDMAQYLALVWEPGLRDIVWDV